MMSSQVCTDEQHYRRKNLLQQAIGEYDLPAYAFCYTAVSGALLLFSAGATLGAVLAVHAPGEHAILTFVVLSSRLLIALAASLCCYWEHVSERRAALLSTLGHYMDAQADVARHANQEAH
jgi:hypothetical protein